jgi:hypothetical protein
MQTPAKYWRVPCDLDVEVGCPSEQLLIPEGFLGKKTLPAIGDGITIAAYDEGAQTGLLKWLGLIVGKSDEHLSVEWTPAGAEIWVDSPSGRSFWKKGVFGFARNKNADYGLHQLWQSHFPSLELRESFPTTAKSPTRKVVRSTSVKPERLNPIEIVGVAGVGINTGVVYVLKSAYGYKVGRTKNVPARMRAFGVHLPFVYTIPLCVWFDDCHTAERQYHETFASKRINGEWFDLDEQDIDRIRQRA